MKKIVVFHEIYNLKVFKKTIFLLKKNFKFVSLNSLISSNDNNLCHITFDDAHFTFINAFEFLKKQQIPTTLFLSIDKINKKNNFWFQDIDYINNQLKDEFNKEFNNHFNVHDNKKRFNSLEIIKSFNIDKIHDFIKIIKSKYKLNIPYVNISLNEMEKLKNEKLLDFGAHTMNHPILANESTEKANYEIKKSIDELEIFLQRKTTTFAYPNGIVDLDFTKREKDILKINNIKYAFTMNLDSYNEDKFDNYEIPRISFGENLFKNYLINKNVNFYKKISNINIPFLRSTENYRRLQLKKILYK